LRTVETPRFHKEGIGQKPLWAYRFGPKDRPNGPFDPVNCRSQPPTVRCELLRFTTGQYSVTALKTEAIFGFRGRHPRGVLGCLRCGEEPGALFLRRSRTATDCIPTTSADGKRQRLERMTGSMSTVLNVGGGEILVIFIAALVILGPERLPKFANDVGKWLTKLRTLTSGVQSEFRDALAADEFKESLDGVRAVMDMKNQIVGELTGITSAVTASVNSSVSDVKSALPTFNVKSTTGGSFYTAPTEWPEPVSKDAENDGSGSAADTDDAAAAAPSPVFAGAFDPSSLDDDVTAQPTGVLTPTIPPPDGIFADEVAVDHPMNHQSAGIPAPESGVPDVLLSDRIFTGGSR
jgi:Tat protein translocase TatB subunit